jgi:anti-sigma regulatory factor (Ser/Thr protein kinase)
VQPDEPGAANGEPEVVRLRSELAGARATCRRQAGEIAVLTAVNAGLRGPPADKRNGHGDALALRLPLDRRAPATARTLVLSYRDRVTGVLLEEAQLVLSEMVTNSLRHSGAAPEEGLVIRTRLTDTGLRLEVENPGQDGVVALRAPGGARGGGYGLNIVEHVSRRWGVERGSDAGTRVWADLARSA